MDYQSERGGRVVFQDIAKPLSMEWGSPLEAMEAVLELEKTVSLSSVVKEFFLHCYHKFLHGDQHRRIL
jgi:ferritin